MLILQLGNRIFIRLSIDEEQVKALLDNPHIELIGRNEILRNDDVLESITAIPKVTSNGIQAGSLR